MATSKEYIEYVASQLSDVGAVRFKKMFGEYMIYINDKPVFLVCDDCVYVKILPALDSILQNPPIGLPYDSAKPHYMMDPDDKDLLCAAARILEPVTPLPKPRKKRT
jgi:TfoX/Sxy family transcriptional regulator of competence genes